MDLKNFYLLSREQRGKVLLEQGAKPKALQEQAFAIPSQFVKNRKYKVIQHYHGFACTCPDFHYRKLGCKHIWAIKTWIELREYYNKEGIYEGTESVVPSCIYCCSLKVVKNGKRKNKQRFKCEACNKTFVANQEFKGLKAEPKVITLAMDLYFKGLSLRKIKDIVKQFYSLEVSHEVIRQWKNKFMQKINGFVDTQKPELKGAWHTDEPKVKTKKKWQWVWNTLDEETRFLIASTVSSDREVSTARKHFREAKQNNNDARPQAIFTDGLQGYHRAINKEFHTMRKETIHIRSIGFKKNQLIERHHSNQKERIKVMRGLANRKSLERHARDYRTYYNFVRPNQALNGLTPSQKAGIELPLKENKWLSLIKQSNR